MLSVAYLVTSSLVTVISLVLWDSDTDSENVSLIRYSVSVGQKTCSSEGVSLIGIYNNVTHFSLKKHVVMPQ